MAKQPTVYILEDDPAVRDSLAALVKSMQLPSECFGSADEFLSVYDSSLRGCLILDIRLPGMSGIELQEELVDRGSQLPIIMVTGHGDAALKERAISLGAVEFVEKPYYPHFLRETIRKAIEGFSDP